MEYRLALIISIYSGNNIGKVVGEDWCVESCYVAPHTENKSHFQWTWLNSQNIRMSVSTSWNIVHILISLFISTRYILRVPSHLTMYSRQSVHLCYDRVLCFQPPLSRDNQEWSKFFAFTGFICTTNSHLITCCKSTFLAWDWMFSRIPLRSSHYTKLMIASVWRHILLLVVHLIPLNDANIHEISSSGHGPVVLRTFPLDITILPSLGSSFEQYSYAIGEYPTTIGQHLIHI